MIGTRWGRIFAAAALLLPLAVNTQAADETYHGRLEARAQEEGLEPWDIERGRHLVEAFAGYTFIEGRSGFTAGADYEFHFHRVWGVGLLGQWAGEEIKTTTLGIPLFVHPRNAARLMFMPGLAMVDETDEDLFVFRFGILYDIFVNQVSITPTIYGDIIDGKWATIVGLTIGYTF